MHRARFRGSRAISYRGRHAAVIMTCARLTRGTDDKGNYLGKQTWSLRRHERRPSYTHSAAPVLGPRAATPGVAANPGPSVDVSYCELCSADGSSPWS